MKAVGSDIGTTMICGVLMDGETGKLLDSRTLSNDTSVQCVQMNEAGSISRIRRRSWRNARRILEAFQDGEEDIVSVGVTGQMHGILYTDVGGRAVSPLYTWQDRRGDLPWQREPRWKRRDLGGRSFPGEDWVSGGLRIRSCDSLIIT